MWVCEGFLSVYFTQHTLNWGVSCRPSPFCLVSRPTGCSSSLSPFLKSDPILSLLPSRTFRSSAQQRVRHDDYCSGWHYSVLISDITCSLSNSKYFVRVAALHARSKKTILITTSNQVWRGWGGLLSPLYPVAAVLLVNDFTQLLCLP